MVIDRGEKSASRIDADTPERRPWVVFDRTVRLGDLLTSCSVLISALGLILTWTNAERDHRKEQADNIRNAAATVLQKMDRWEEISLHSFDDLDGASIDISRRFQNQESAETVRDEAWTKIDAVFAAARNRQFDEQIEGSYATLYGYDPQVRTRVRNAIEELDARQSAMFAHLKFAAQAVILQTDPRLAAAHPAVLGDGLRRSMAVVGDQYRSDVDGRLKDVRMFLERVAASTDDKLRSSRSGN